METIDDDAEKFSVDFVKVIDKRLAKQYHVQTFPTLTMFRDGEMTPFIGDLTNAAQVREFFLPITPNQCGLFGRLRRRGGGQNDPLRDSGLWTFQFWY